MFVLIVSKGCSSGRLQIALAEPSNADFSKSLYLSKSEAENDISNILIDQ